MLSDFIKRVLTLLFFLIIGIVFVLQLPNLVVIIISLLGGTVLAGFLIKVGFYEYYKKGKEKSLKEQHDVSKIASRRARNIAFSVSTIFVVFISNTIYEKSLMSGIYSLGVMASIMLLTFMSLNWVYEERYQREKKHKHN